jgi:hypothetical protein
MKAEGKKWSILYRPLAHESSTIQSSSELLNQSSVGGSVLLFPLPCHLPKPNSVRQMGPRSISLLAEVAIGPIVIPMIVLVSAKQAATQSPRIFSDMQSEIAGDHKDHDHYADDVEDIHCLAPTGYGR